MKHLRCKLMPDPIHEMLSRVGDDRYPPFIPHLIGQSISHSTHKPAAHCSQYPLRALYRLLIARYCIDVTHVTGEVVIDQQASFKESSSEAEDDGSA